MTPEQKQLLRKTWRQVETLGDAAARLFYDRLFEIDPTTRPLFRGVDMAAQRQKLLQALAHVVQGLDHLEILVPTIEDLGRRHAGYGVEDGHYDSVGAALLWTLEQGLAGDWTPEAKAAWTEAYTTIAGVMRHAAAEIAPAAGPPTEIVA